MPGGDHTGPLGQGPRTGRAGGYCAGYDMPGYANPIPGMGMGRGRGGRHGWRRTYYATGLTGWQRGGVGRGWRAPLSYPAIAETPPLTREQELGLLQADLRGLEQRAEQLRKRIEELNIPDAEKSGV